MVYCDFQKAIKSKISTQKYKSLLTNQNLYPQSNKHIHKAKFLLTKQHAYSQSKISTHKAKHILTKQNLYPESLHRFVIKAHLTSLL